MKRNRLCKLIGHRWDPEAAAMNILACERCGADDYAGHEPEDIEQPWHVAVITRAYWTIRDPFRYGFRRGIRILRLQLRSWLRCPCCEGRFGRHDWDKCVPFALMLAVILVEMWK